MSDKAQAQIIAESVKTGSVEALPVSGVTPRSVLIGTIASALLAFMAICTQALGGGLGANAQGTGALFLLFLLVCLTPLLKRLALFRSGLKPAELMVIFSMLLMASAVPINGTIIYLLPHMAGFVHYATTENEWGIHVIPLLPNGIAIKDPAVVKGFFEGGVEPWKVPYGAWIGPLFAWGVFLASLYMTMISLMVIFRKRWVEQERLSFPIAELPLSLVQAQTGERPLFHNNLFWSGFSLVGLWGSSGMVHRFFPAFPPINFSTYTRIYRNSIGISFSINFIVLGISYLVSLDILWSILLFTFIAFFQLYLIQVFGSGILGTPPYRPYAHQTHLHQEVLGALIVLVGVGLYEARNHLRDVFRKTIGSATSVDDQDEMIPYQTAVIGSIVGMAFTCWWLWLTGVSVWIVPIFVGVMLVTYLGITRILAEAGVTARAPLSPMQVFLHTAGTEMLGGSTITGFFLAQPWAFSEGPHVMASASTAMKLTHRKGVRSRPLFYAMILALLVGGLVSAVTLLHFAYTQGTYGFTNSWYVIKALNYHLNYFGEAIKEPTGEGQPIRILWSGVGAVGTGLLILARKRFFWWPIHPIGLAIGTLAPGWWLSILLALLIKRNLLKYGGASLYGRIRPFFLGLIMGEAVMANLGSLITLVTGTPN